MSLNGNDPAIGAMCGIFGGLMAAPACFVLAWQCSASRWPRRLKRNAEGIGWARAELLDTYSRTHRSEHGRSTTWYYSLVFEARYLDGSPIRVEAYDQVGKCGNFGLGGGIEVAYLQKNPLDFWLTGPGATNGNESINAFTSQPIFIVVGAIFVICGFLLTQVLPIMSGVLSKKGVYSKTAAGPAASLSCYFVFLGLIAVAGKWCGGKGQSGRRFALPGRRVRLATIQGALDCWCDAPRFTEVTGATQDAELAALLGGPAALAQKLRRLDKESRRLVGFERLILMAEAILLWAFSYSNISLALHASLWVILWLLQLVLLRMPNGLFQRMALRCLDVDGVRDITRMQLSERDSARGSGESHMPVIVFTLISALVEPHGVTQMATLAPECVDPSVLGSCETSDFTHDTGEASCEIRFLL